MAEYQVIHDDQVFNECGELILNVAFLGIKGLPSQAGADRVVEALVKRMPAFGVRPTVYCDTKFTSKEFSIRGVDLVRIPSVPGKHTRSTTLALVAALHATLLGKFDLIHLHNLEASFVLPILRTRYPVISTSHGFAYRRDKWGPIAKRLIRLMEQPFVRFSSETTSVSAKDAQELSARFGRAVRYIPNGVGSRFDPNLDAAAQLIESHGLTAGRYLILVAGRLIYSKGIHLAIDAVNRSDMDIPLLVVGDDGGFPVYLEELRKLAGHRIRFQPLITDPELLYGLMAQSKCLIFPSYYEAMSMVLLEAAHLGVPILSSDLPENLAVLGDEATYFESGSVDSLIEKLKWVHDHSATMEEMGIRASNRVARDFSWDAIAGQYAELYSDVLQLRSRQHTDPIQAK
jgi:glycosyltransferase involved in cell wall biosynthesis